MKIIFFLLLFFAAYQFCPAQIFTKLSDDPTVSDNRYSEGSSWGDINNDGHLDLFVPHLYDDNYNILFINNGDGSFTERTDGPVVTDFGTTSGGSFGDFDNDGHLDLFVSNYFDFNNSLYINDGAGSFTKIDTGQIVTDGGFSFGSSVVDYDNDGFLDIYVTNGAFTVPGADNFLYKNNGDGSFIKITGGEMVNDGQHSSSAAWCDYDNDGDLDLFVANGASENPADIDNIIYLNNGNGTFTAVNPETIGIDHSYSSNGSWADFDNDGDFDLFVTNFLGNNNLLYKNNADGTFTKVTEGIVVNDGGDSVSSTWGDFDNDGDLDLYVTNDYGENNNLYENNGDGSFTKIIQGDAVNDGGRSNGTTWADYNNDGFLDLFVPNGQRPVTQSNILYRNNATPGNSWVNIKCTGTLSNRSAVGTKIRARTVIGDSTVWQLRQVAGSSGFNAQNSFNIEFGFGVASSIDSLFITWPSGSQELFTNVPVNIFYEAVEGEGLITSLSSTKDNSLLPADFSLHQNYPNPFNPVTRIGYSISKPVYVEIDIYNFLGQRLRSLLKKQQTAGNHSVNWNGRDDANRAVSTGIYLYRIKTGTFVSSKKMVLLR